MHVYRWDLDRTYLDTDIHSVRGLIRTAMETADDKRTVPGAPALIRALVDHDPEARIAILSGSPTQMRDVLAQKLALDGIRPDSLVLKDNLRNLRMGRFRAIRGQLGYKLPQLLALRLGQPPEARETLFGDDSEVDALIYALYADAVEGRVTADEVAAVLRHGGAYADQVDHALRSLARLTATDAVEDIFIHIDRRVPLHVFDCLGPRVVPVFSWFQAAVVLADRGRLNIDAIDAVSRACQGRGTTTQDFVGLAQDLVRRSLAPAALLPQVFEVTPSLASHTTAVARAVELLDGARRPRPPESRRDYRAFLAATT